MTIPTVLIMAGGTGGHVFPALAVADCFRSQGINVEWLGTAAGIESQLVNDAKIPMNLITISGVRGKGLVRLLKAPWQILSAIYQSIKVIKRVQPICVLGMGGFVSGPGGIAAWLKTIPLIIHEQNAVAGTTNRLLATFAKRVMQGYPITLGGKKACYVGNPVRTDIVSLAAPELRWQQRRCLPLQVLVLGGSLGAKAINDVIPKALAQLAPNKRPSVWHQTGKLHIEAVTAVYQSHQLEAKVEAFIGDMAAAYAWADVVICRAGALTVAELTAAGVGALLIPLPHAIDDHQTENARWLEKNNAGEVLKQSALSIELLAQKIIEWQINKEKLLAMAIAARALAKKQAAEMVVKNCLEVAYAR